MKKVFYLILMGLFIIPMPSYSAEIYLYCQYEGKNNTTVDNTYIIDTTKEKVYGLTEEYKVPLKVLKFTPYEIKVDVSIYDNTAYITFDRIEGKSIIHGTKPYNEIYVLGKCTTSR